MNLRWRVARPFTGDGKCSAAPADANNHDRAEQSSGHTIPHLGAISLAQYRPSHVAT